MSLARQCQQRDSLIHIVVAGFLMPGKIALASVKLVAPLHRHPPVKVVGHGAVQLVDIDRFQTLTQAVAFGAQARHRLFMIVPLDIEAVPERLNDQVVNLIVKPQLRQKPVELLLQHFLAHELLGTFPPKAGAMVVDVFPLLDFGRHGASAMAAAYQPREGELADTSPGLGVTRFLVPPIKDVLHAGP